MSKKRAPRIPERTTIPTGKFVQLADERQIFFAVGEALAGELKLAG